MATTTGIFCRTTLNYAGGAGTPGGGAVDVVIHDGRQADLPGWETCGFELVPHASVLRRWDDDVDIVRVNHPEMEALAQQLTGCDRTRLVGHIKRSPAEAARHHDLAPITLVHSDFADSYGDKIRDRYRDEAEGDDDLLGRARRIVVMQFWRNLGPPKMDMPLAFCDARTVPRSDIRPFPVNDYAGGGFDFEALAVVAPDDPEHHRWYAFPEMNVEEVVAFRTYDTARITTGESYWTPHSAFRDPEVELGRPSRSSIEMRVACLFL